MPGLAGLALVSTARDGAILPPPQEGAPCPHHCGLPRLDASGNSPGSSGLLPAGPEHFQQLR